MNQNLDRAIQVAARKLERLRVRHEMAKNDGARTKYRDQYGAALRRIGRILDANEETDAGTIVGMSDIDESWPGIESKIRSLLKS